MNSKLRGYAILTRPANLPTAASDILAGLAIVSFTSGEGLSLLLLHKWNALFLVLSSICLYAGGVVLNDVFDIEVDTIERPERPIPSGLILIKSATLFGIFLFVLGVLFAFLSNALSGYLAIALCMVIVLYDALGKKHSFFGPLNMGLCRGFNLILGMSLMGSISNLWYAIIPVVYIFAITLISRGEVHGENKRHIVWAGALYLVVVFFVIGIVFDATGRFFEIIPFIALFSFLIFKPLIKAYKVNSPSNIKGAVVGGVLSLIVLDASLAAGFLNWWYGLLILLLLPLSKRLSKLFAVT